MTCGCKSSGSNEINTLTCGGEVPCSPAVGQSSCACGCNPCQCGRSSMATPTPFYNQGCSVQESHNTIINQEVYVTAITTSSSFNIPACGTTATITIPGLQRIQIGSYLWNSIYGYFEVISFDFLSSQVVIKNTCAASCDPGVQFASAGTLVPACTMFNVVDPPCSSDTETLVGVYVDTDFVAPAIGNCIDIIVTSITGLASGMVVQISSGLYRIAAIISSTIITICNDGSGVTPGTVVAALDATLHHITPVIPTSENACTNDPNPTGSLITCHGGVQAPLDGVSVGQIPVLIDATTNEVQFQTLDLPTSICTILTSCVNLVNGVTVYVVVVADSSIFILGDILIIHDPQIETVRWEVTSVALGPTHIQITRTTPQVGDLQVGCNNTPICLAPCCEQLAAGTQICSYDWSPAFNNSYVLDSGTNKAEALAAPASTSVGTASYGVFQNPTCNVMNCLFTIDYVFDGYFDATSIQGITQLQFLTEFGTDNVLIANPFPGFTYGTNTASHQHYNVHYVAANKFYVGYSTSQTVIFALAAGKKLQIYGRTTLNYLTYDAISIGAAPSFTVETNISKLHGIGVAMQT